MIKVKISYTDNAEKVKVLETLQEFNVLHIGKEYDRGTHKSVYLLLE